MEHNEIINSMKVEIKTLRNQFEKLKSELNNKKHEIARKQKGMLLFAEELSVRRIESPAQTAQPILVTA